MKRSTPCSEEVTREHIVEVGARVIRRCDYDHVGIADIMKQAAPEHLAPTVD